MKAKTLSKEDWSRIEDCVRKTIMARAEAIKTSIDSYSSQFCWGMAEEMREDFKLLDKLEELCGEEEE